MNTTKQLDNFNSLPQKLIDKEGRRWALLGDIFESVELKRKKREELFQPVQRIVQNHPLIKKTHILKFKAEIYNNFEAFHDKLFKDLLKQDTGDFRESYSNLKTLIDKYNLSLKQELLDFLKEFDSKLKETAKSMRGSTGYGIQPMLRARKEAQEVYSYIFGLEFLEPRYTILFQDTHIEQLSPGQRGALLLIFYLLVNRDKTPIILDQPEENLDNETIINLLVPVLTKAKETRQVIMVTHNPNLAVVCDAEQIIYAEFDRQNKNKITYTSGAIESPEINKKIVDVLEGTMPAFNNRKSKYL